MKIMTSKNKQKLISIQNITSGHQNKRKLIGIKIYILCDRTGTILPGRISVFKEQCQVA